MNEQHKTLVEWLHEHPRRMIAIRPTGEFDPRDETWHGKEDSAEFRLESTLPDGRKVVSLVRVFNDFMSEPEAGSHIAMQAELAVKKLLNGEKA